MVEPILSPWRYVCGYTRLFFMHVRLLEWWLSQPTYAPRLLLHESALRSAVKPADTEQRLQAKKHQAASRQSSRCFMFHSQRAKNLIHYTEHKAIHAPESPGGWVGGWGRSRNWNTNETFVCSDLQHAAPPLIPHCWTSSVIISKLINNMILISVNIFFVRDFF